MKKLMIGLAILSLTNLVYPQNSNGGSEVLLEGVTVSPNMHYLSKVSNGTLSKRVLDLENMAARYDITKYPLFDNSDRNYTIVFKQSKGFILATFDKDGNIIKSYERFKDIAVPVSVRNYIGQNYPGWIHQGNSYLVTYSGKQDVKKIYKVEIEKGNLQKKIRIGS